jgi:hypothetical protein
MLKRPLCHFKRLRQPQHRSLAPEIQVLRVSERQEVRVLTWRPFGHLDLSISGLIDCKLRRLVTASAHNPPFR